MFQIETYLYHQLKLFPIQSEFKLRFTFQWVVILPSENVDKFHSQRTGLLQGPFDYNQAKEYGIDVWECHDNCYTRVDRHGSKYTICG